ncbi:class I SAM-dependent methyltransferase [Actinocrispum wychmicini]|uniref:Methyltransferase family protein n=1 Tax=Actinocrispum wychmicini TaxID=1213861 RepID=A0A4R2IUN0_9PSEU|nr:class I SAM-dependent methyltransferase [Actinocrispum wychmicini]TCO46625.1 methyltransferase family protein [Actinocrispum wychmicini]
MKYRTSVFEPLHASLFGPLHATYYDQFHQGKNYRAEVDQMRGVFRREGPVASVLDLGCGTGRHMEALAASGYDVVGVDRSPAMAALARSRLADFPAKAAVVEADLFELAMDRTFDAVIMMFSLIGYQVTNQRVRSTLDALRRQVRPGGLVLFDVMDAAAVLADSKQESGIGRFMDGDKQMLVAHSTVVNPVEQVIELGLRMWEIAGDEVVDQVDEKHIIRYFQPREVSLLLQVAGLEMIGSAPLAAQNTGPAWSRLVWARRA